VSWDKGFNFRGTIGFVTDGQGETYSLGNLYPETRNGVTFGFTTDATSNTVNRSVIDRRLSGTSTHSSAPPVKFKIDLPAPGNYFLKLAIGDEANAETGIKLVVRDSDRLLFTITGATGIAEFLDANGTLFTAAAWPNGNRTRLITVSSKLLQVEWGDGVGSTGLAHIFLSQTNTTHPLRTSIGANRMRRA
jgi:hypothetical protein